MNSRPSRDRPLSKLRAESLARDAFGGSSSDFGVNEEAREYLIGGSSISRGFSYDSDAGLNQNTIGKQITQKHLETIREEKPSRQDTHETQEDFAINAEFTDSDDEDNINKKQQGYGSYNSNTGASMFRNANLISQEKEDYEN